MWCRGGVLGFDRCNENDKDYGIYLILSSEMHFGPDLVFLNVFLNIGASCIRILSRTAVRPY